MLVVERKIQNWIEKNMFIIAFLYIFVAGTLIRIFLRNFLSWDAEYCLLPWYDEIKKNGAILGLNMQVGDYNLLYQFIIAIFTYIPIKPLYVYKILSCIFDIALAFLGCGFTRELFGKENKSMHVAIFSLIYLSPIVYFNSACWGQCDSIYTFFTLLTLYLILKEHYSFAMCMYGIAFSFKFQAVFFLPFLFVFYFKNKKFSIFQFGYVPLMMILTAIPNLLNGRSVYDIFQVYFKQAEGSTDISKNYPSFWNIFNNAQRPEMLIPMRYMAILFKSCILGLGIIWICKKKILFSYKNVIWLSFLMTYACVLFLPAMHERYGFLYEILALIIVLMDKKTVVFLIPMYICTFITYSYCLFANQYNSLVVSLVNVLAFISYIIYFIKNCDMDENTNNI